MYKLSKRSNEQYESLHADLQKIIDYALMVSQVDFIVVEGHRPLERQMKLYKEGKSRIDGIRQKGMHNHFPSLAFDFCATGKKAYDMETLLYLVGMFTGVAGMLYQFREISHVLRSGANWDMDGEIITDQRFLDAPHLELYKPETYT